MAALLLNSAPAGLEIFDVLAARAGAGSVSAAPANSNDVSPWPDAVVVSYGDRYDVQAALEIGSDTAVSDDAGGIIGTPAAQNVAAPLANADSAYVAPSASGVARPDMVVVYGTDRCDRRAAPCVRRDTAASGDAADAAETAATTTLAFDVVCTPRMPSS
jgi:hypothetical protein